MSIKPMSKRTEGDRRGPKTILNLSPCGRRAMGSFAPGVQPSLSYKGHLLGGPLPFCPQGLPWVRHYLTWVPDLTLVGRACSGKQRVWFFFLAGPLVDLRFSWLDSGHLGGARFVWCPGGCKGVTLRRLAS